MSARRTIWRRDRLFVEAVLEDDGDLVFEGQDLNGWLGYAEYEYWVTAPAALVPRVVAALGGSPGDDVLGLIAAHAEEIVGRGESTWLKSLGIEPGISTHSTD
ncbi:hypothetical protein ISU10_22090 [Nocardioides agariphilus]|jgi:hypothetical protein|uniref:Uncharacterized protein n=1 Tax=Nocardioides agariphilus TaxID=433664 RepID=A0A930YKP6_9ACTN|nr:hypothetical protein [Nocardioides agariphilus]MBF4770473.1 hypothetical protein [Nocardioides agariphilus]